MNTSWDKVSPWYKKIVGKEGHYYHKEIIIPNLLKEMSLSNKDSILELACGNGIFEKNVSAEIRYTGVDVSASLINEANKNIKSDKHKFMVLDITKSLKYPIKYTKAVCILALQNVLDTNAVIENAANNLENNGELFLVLNHPFYRIPGESFWSLNEKSNIQSRCVTKYLTTFSKEIYAEPSKGAASEKTVSVHFSLEDLSKMLFQNGFVITDIKEWVSNKRSSGKHARAENKARSEFPLFMMLKAKLC